MSWITEAALKVIDDLHDAGVKVLDPLGRRALATR